MISNPSVTDSILTDDGSLTCRHPEFGETYHALQGARSEAEVKFILPSRLEPRLADGHVRILDIGFGLGVNCRASLETARRLSSASLVIDTLEADPLAWERALALYPDCALTRSLIEDQTYQEESIRVTRYDGDMRQSLPSLPGPYDLIFHDPFSPMKNTEAWTLDLFRLLFARLHPEGLLLTYSESTAVRAGLLQAGFHIGQTPAAPPHRAGTMAAPRLNTLPHPLDPAPFTLFPKNIPFRDPALHDTGHQIRARREAEVRVIKRLTHPEASPD